MEIVVDFTDISLLRIPPSPKLTILIKNLETHQGYSPSKIATSHCEVKQHWTGVWKLMLYTHPAGTLISISTASCVGDNPILWWRNSNKISNITSFGRHYTYIETLWKEVKWSMKWPYSMQLNQSRNVLFQAHLFYDHIWSIEH